MSVLKLHFPICTWYLSTVCFLYLIFDFCTSGLHPVSARSISTNAGSGVMFMKHSKNLGFLVCITSHVFLFCFVFFCCICSSVSSWRFTASQHCFWKGPAHIEKSKARIFKVFSVFWKARGRNLLAECGLKARAEGESIILKWSSTIMYMAVICAQGQGGVLWFFRGEFLTYCPSAPFVLRSFLLVLRACFNKVLRSRGGAAAWGCLGSWVFDLWPFMLQLRAIYLHSI